MKKVIGLISLIALISFSCRNDDGGNVVINNNSCNFFAEIIEDETFNAVETSNYSISSVELNQDCLEITIGASGCDTDSWVVNLYSIDTLLSDSPIERAVKIELINNQACLAFFQKTITFDLTPFQMESQNQMVLNIEGWDTQIIYGY